MKPESLSHRQTWDLLPWLVNGTVNEADGAAAETHLLGCADCRDEYAFQSRLALGLQADVKPDAAAHAGWQRLALRMDATDVDAQAMSRVGRAGSMSDGTSHTHARRTPRRIPGSRRATRWLVAIASLQAVTLVALATFVLVGRDPVAGYRTLSLPAATTTTTIRFVPSPGLTVGELQALLDEAGVMIVSGNRDSSIYGLAVIGASPDDRRPADVASAIVKLRGARGALLVEPVDGAVDAPR